MLFWGKIKRKKKDLRKWFLLDIPGYTTSFPLQDLFLVTTGLVCTGHIILLPLSVLGDGIRDPLQMPQPMAAQVLPCNVTVFPENLCTSSCIL